MGNQKDNMLCEPAEDHGWECLIRENDEWKEFGKFDSIKVKDRDVDLPVVQAVTFDKDNCKIKEGEHGKSLVCD